ncbi:hypothetical protein Tco_0576862 [Tanacetum coccineum]
MGALVLPKDNAMSLTAYADADQCGNVRILRRTLEYVSPAQSGSCTDSCAGLCEPMSPSALRYRVHRGHYDHTSFSRSEVDEMEWDKGIVRIKGVKKEALHTLRQKLGQYICCQNHKLIADIEDDIMDPETKHAAIVSLTPKHPSETLVLHNEDGNRARSRDTQTSSTLVIASGRNLGDEEELGEGCMSPKQGEDDFDMILMRHYPVT